MPNIVNAGVIAIIAGFAVMAVVGAVDEFDVRREGAASSADAAAGGDDALVSLDEPSGSPETEPPIPLDDPGDDDRRGKHEKHGDRDRDADDNDEEDDRRGDDKDDEDDR